MSAEQPPIPTAPTPSEAGPKAATRPESAETRGLLKRASSNVPVLVAILALCISGVSAVYTYFNQQTQQREAQLTELRAIYPRITALESLKNPSTADSSELDTDLGVAAAILRNLHYEATSSDIFFVAEGYRLGNTPYSAIPLYQHALSRATAPDDAATALRALALAAAAVGEKAQAEAAAQKAIQYSRAITSPPDRVRMELVTERDAVYVDVQAHECARAEQQLHHYTHLQLSSPTGEQDSFGVLLATETEADTGPCLKTTSAGSTKVETFRPTSPVFSDLYLQIRGPSAAIGVLARSFGNTKSLGGFIVAPQAYGQEDCTYNVSIPRTSATSLRRYVGQKVTFSVYGSSKYAPKLCQGISKGALG
jgi:hypothetical protein